MAEENNFFAQQTRSSKIKAMIVSEYFPKYCKIIHTKGQVQIRYLDLYSGPGIYENGAMSTPMLIGQACATDIVLRTVVKLLFNDNVWGAKLKENFESAFSKVPFRYPPVFANVTVGENEKLRNYLLKQHKDQHGKNPFPTLLFIDPFGYKGVDTKVLASFMQNWGNEIFLFVNIKRIHAAIFNDKFDDLMLAVFPTTVESIRHERQFTKTVPQRLNLIIAKLVEEYRNILGENLFSTAFQFQEEDSVATSHFIMHFTKHKRGYDLVKQIYNEFDNIGATLDQYGNYTFDAKKLDMTHVPLFDFNDQKIEHLSNLLMSKYKGCTLTANKLFEEHQVTTSYARKNYVETLRQMVDDSKIKATFTDNGNHKVTVLISENCILDFT